MDWHFKVKDPNTVKGAPHRSWYISEKVNKVPRYYMLDEEKTDK